MDEVAILDAIDVALASFGAKREAGGVGFCASDPPGAENRGFVCENSVSVGTWELNALRADGGQRVSATLEIRRFASEEAERDVKLTAVERYGGGVVGLPEGAFSWCYDDLVWTDDLVLLLSYGCHIGLPHVDALGAVRDVILRAGVPSGAAGAIGVAGSHSGWSSLVGKEGRVDVPDAARFERFVKVTGVAADDVLWVREDRPSSFVLSTDGSRSGDLRPKVGQLAPDATCIGVVYRPPGDAWWLVRSGEVQGWVSSRYLAPSDATGCGL
jgi:hypothetical protein